MTFFYADLFAGIGGFHAALDALGGSCVYAVENDLQAATIYKNNWGLDPYGDIRVDATAERVTVPPHDVLVGGFPCQPFSKSGAQLGMEETRGTLFWNILQIIQKRRPALVLLENVRNLTGPRHIHEWQIIIQTLRAENYRVCDTPAIFSPHLLPPANGGRPQIRERVFIVAIREPARDANLRDSIPVVVNEPYGLWDPQSWDLDKDLLLDEAAVGEKDKLTEKEIHWINAWDNFVKTMRPKLGEEKLPSFPIWADSWQLTSSLTIPSSTPLWKSNLLTKNAALYTAHKRALDQWTKEWGIYSSTFPASRRKLEWQAQDCSSLWDTVMHFRPSGIRAKKATYLPALVAINQTSIVGPKRRRITPREAATLQGFPAWFDFSGQSDSATFKQLGNSVNVGVVWHVIRQTVHHNVDTLMNTAPGLVEAFQKSSETPDHALLDLKTRSSISQ